MREVMYYEKGPDDEVFCRVCPRLCRIPEGKKGFCRVRRNRGGVLYAENYGRCAAYALDPVEKKPLYHFYPGWDIFSIGAVGCNLRCGFCQNWQIAHQDAETVELSPERAVELAREQSERGYPCVGIAYTYSEPFMWYEYVYDTARLARQAGLKNVLVTNGYINEEPLRRLLPYIDAMNIDVKAFTDEFYRTNCAGSLEPVLRTVEVASRECHVELTTLLVTGLNDSPEEIERLVDWVAGISREIPLHFSRYFPRYRFKLEPTPVETLLRAKEIAARKLPYVYIGNVNLPGAGDTVCPGCGEVVVERIGYTTRVKGLKDGKCTWCGQKLNFVGVPC